MLECKTEQPVWTPTANGANKKLVLHVQLRCGSLSITTPVSHLANEFDVRSELHGQVSLAAVSQNLCRSWGYERLQNSKKSLKACFENVNVIFYCVCETMDWTNCYQTQTLVLTLRKEIVKLRLVFIAWVIVWMQQ